MNYKSQGKSDVMTILRQAVRDLQGPSVEFDVAIAEDVIDKDG